ncbi:unnamed protein product [Penicillium viridicatum]
MTIQTSIHDPATADGWHGIIPSEQFPAEKGRYHLYIGLFCPFAHRVNFVRHLKGLIEFIDISIVKPYPKGDAKDWPGWRFPASDDEYPADPDYKERYSVPLLWDKKKGTAVCNESAELLRWLPTAFNELLPPSFATIDLYPIHLRDKIDAVTPWLQSDVNAGVYKAGFASSQEDYNKHVIPVFGALNKLEKIIAINGGPFVLCRHLTELDIRLYATLIRFDTVYVQHFKCNLGTIRHDYPVLNNWLKGMYWNVKAAKDSTNFLHIKENYTKSHADINPKAITPMGPFPDVEEGFEENWNKLAVGEVKHPAVLDYETTIPGL